MQECSASPGVLGLHCPVGTVLAGVVDSVGFLLNT